MRFLGLLLLVGACGTSGGVTEADEPRAEFRGGGNRELKIHPKLLADWQAGLPARFELTLVVDVVEAEADRARLIAIGAHAVAPVAVTERGPYGVKAAALEGPSSSSWLVHAPVEILLYLAELPWVTGIALANAWPDATRLPDEVDRRLDPELRSALRTFGEERPFAIGGIGEATGCLDEERKRELARLGAVIGSVVAKPPCEYTIFTFELPIGSLADLASLPWIVQLEGSRPMFPERD